MRPLPKPQKPRGPKRGRPAGHFTQHRKLDRLRETLESHPAGLTLAELASLLHVTTRSVRRYLDELKVRTEVESVPSAPGGAHAWRIAPAERGRTVPLRRAQAYGLLATRAVFASLKGSALFDELDLAHRQLLQVASRPSKVGSGKGEIRADARLEDRLRYVAHPPSSYASRADELDDLFRAVAELHVLRFRYRDAREERVTAHPYAMLLWRGAIHVVAHDVERDDTRCFLFDRMTNLAASDEERFTLPPELKVDDFLHGAFGPGRALSKVRLLVEFDARVADEIRARKHHPSQKIATSPDGRIRLSMVVGDAAMPEVRRWILGFGEAARVVEPESLAAEIASALTRAAARYG